MNKKVFAITPEVSNAIERRFYIMKSYESLLAVLGRSYAETATADYRAMIEDYRQLYQKACIDFSCARDALFNRLIGTIPIRYSFNFDRLEVKCEW